MRLEQVRKAGDSTRLGGDYPEPMRPTRWLVLAAVAVLSAVVSVSPDATSGFVRLGSVARAQDAEIKIGANLRAIQSVSLDDAVLAIGDQISVTARQVRGGAVFLDVSLADGHVVKGVPIDEIRKSFRLVG